MPCRPLGLLVTLSLGFIAMLLAVDTCAGERARPFLIGALNASWGPTPQVVGLRDGLLALGYRTLPSTTGESISLSQFRGKKVVLLEFYGVDFAPT
jgi:hypothetical protein